MDMEFVAVAQRGMGYVLDGHLLCALARLVDYRTGVYESKGGKMKFTTVGKYTINLAQILYVIDWKYNEIENDRQNKVDIAFTGIAAFGSGWPVNIDKGEMDASLLGETRACWIILVDAEADEFREAMSAEFVFERDNPAGSR